MAIVAHDGYATVPNGPGKGEPYILAFGKAQFNIPESAVVSYPKKANILPDGEALGRVLATKAPEKWMEYCNPEYLMKVKGEEGTCVYTTFTVEGAPNEGRFLRFISGTIAERNFGLWKDKVQSKIDAGEIQINNDRQRVRLEVLEWTKATDCPTKAQLNPEMNRWNALAKDEYVKSCRVEPEAKKRQLKSAGGGAGASGSNKSQRTGAGAAGANGARLPNAVPEGSVVSASDVTEFDITLKMGPKGTYTISEVGNLVRVIQYKYNDATGKVGGEDAEAEAEGDAEEERDL